MRTYVYRHRRKDNNQVFYVGIGDKRRPYCKHRRNKDWFNITSITDYDVEILLITDNLSEAEELESLLISEYGRAYLNEGTLVNRSTGSTSSGYKHTKEQREYLSSALKGISKSEETRKRMSDSCKTKKKVIDTVTGDIYDSAMSCAILNNIHPAVLRGKLNGNKTNNTNFKYIQNG